jgi:hypothetical protein
MCFLDERPSQFRTAVSDQFVSAARYRRRRSEIEVLERRLTQVFSDLVDLDLLLDRWDGLHPSPERLAAHVETVEIQLEMIETHIRQLRKRRLSAASPRR